MRTLRLTMAAVFLLAASLKVFGVHAAQTMFGSLPVWMQVALLVTEIALGAWLVTGIYRRVAAFMAIVVLSAFIGAITLEMRKENPQPCGCFGSVSAAAYDPAAVRRNLGISLTIDIALMGAAAVLYLRKVGQQTPVAEGVVA